MTAITAIVAIQVYPIWCINGRSIKIDASLHPFGATLKYIAIGIDNIAPQIAALLVAFL